MYKLKKCGIMLLAAFLLLIILSTAVYAQSPAPEYIYFERTTISPTLPGDVIMVAYPDDPGAETELYEAIKSAMIEAIANSRGLWIEVEIAIGGTDTLVIIDYKKALQNGLSYTEVVDDVAGGGDTYLAARPNPVAEMYFDGDSGIIKYKSPTVLAPMTFPAWLGQYPGDAYQKAVWEEFTKSWVVTVKIIEAELPGTGKLSNIKVRIKGVMAKPVPGTDNQEWFAVITDPEILPPSTFVLKPGDVEVLVGLSWYNQ